MSTSANRTDLKWGYFAQALNIGSGLFLLPFVVIYLPVEQVGLWFVFITLGAFAYLLEFGFQPTVARNTTYVYAGARTLSTVGLPIGLEQGSTPHLPLLAELIAGSRFIYKIVAALIVLCLLCGGTLYITSLVHDKSYHHSALIAWWLYATGLIVNFYFGYVNAMLQGRGDVTLANKALIVARCVFLLMGLLGLFFGLGLIGLGVSMLLSSVIGRLIATRYLQSNAAMTAAIGMRNVSGRAVARIMWHNASRLGIVQVSAFLIQRANVLVAASFLGLVPAASYGLTVTVLMTLSGIATAILQIRLPAMTKARAINDGPEVKAIFGEVLLLSWTLFVGGLTLLYFVGNPLLNFLSGNAMFLPALPLLVLGLIFALEMNHSVAATYLTTRNTVPFLWASVFSGIATLGLSLWLAYGWQVWGLIVAQGIVQLAYNNWRWPIMARQDLNSPWVDIIKLGATRIASTLTPRSI